jgi:hypothetical protein
MYCFVPISTDFYTGFRLIEDLHLLAEKLTSSGLSVHFGPNGFLGCKTGEKEKCDNLNLTESQKWNENNFHAGIPYGLCPISMHS